MTNTERWHGSEEMFKVASPEGLVGKTNVNKIVDNGSIKKRRLLYLVLCDAEFIV
jgi:hypothetical protein